MKTGTILKHVGSLLLLMALIVLAVGSTDSSSEEGSQTSQNKTKLPPHRFSNTSRPGRARAQVRAVVKPKTLTKAELMKLAVRLCEEYQSQAFGAFLVQFFSDTSCLEGWECGGLLRDSDWPYWVCRITVDTDTKGKLYARTFELAVDMNTGKPRGDVLKDNGYE
jgi:hypothetical protein